MARKNSKRHIKFAHDILDIIGPIISDNDFTRLKSIRHHIFFNRYEHLLNVAKMSYKMARFFGADIETCTLAGLLHDYHHTYIKSHKHAILAAKNSERFGVSNQVIDIVKSHMYPLGRKSIKRVRGLNFWIVKTADCVAPLLEIGYSLLSLKLRYENIIKFHTNQVILELLSAEPENYVLSAE